VRRQFCPARDLSFLGVRQHLMPLGLGPHAHMQQHLADRIEESC